MRKQHGAREHLLHFKINSEWFYDYLQGSHHRSRGACPAGQRNATSGDLPRCWFCFGDKKQTKTAQHPGWQLPTPTQKDEVTSCWRLQWITLDRNEISGSISEEWKLPANLRVSGSEASKE